MISVIIPALDEASSIGAVVSGAEKSLRRTRHEILVVDGGSKDGTVNLAKKAGARAISEKRRGYGRAYLTGIAASRGRLVVLIDGDGTYPAERIGALCKLLDKSGADVLLASRFAHGPGRLKPGAMSLLNLLGNRLLTYATNLLFRTRLSDSQTGFRVFRASALKRLPLRSSGMEFASELNVLSARAGLNLIEIPVEYGKRRGGSKSKLNPFSDGARHFLFLLKSFASG
ncbi:MAG: glycosyltransferase family 2 protein [archaeon]